MHPSFSPARATVEHLVRGHGVGAGIAGIAAEGAVSAIVAAEVGQRKEYFARVSDDAGLEALLGGAGGGEKFGKIVVGAADQAQGGFPGDRYSGTQRGQCLCLQSGFLVRRA